MNVLEELNLAIQKKNTEIARLRLIAERSGCLLADYENLKSILKRFADDYSHPWPQEDEATRHHRLELLQLATKAINE